MMKSSYSKALQEIGNYLGLDSRLLSVMENPTEHHEQMSSPEVPSRPIFLQKKWWKEALHPLIVFKNDSGEAVALIPNFWGHYRRTNPLTGKKETITSKEAATFQKKAFYFYPVFNRQLRTTEEMIRFPLRGNLSLLFFISLLTLFTTLLALVPLFAVQWIFNHIFDEGDLSLIWQLSFAIIVAAFSSAFFLYLRNLTLLRFNGIFAYRLQPALWIRLLQLKMPFFKKKSKRLLFKKVMMIESLRQILSGCAAQILFSTLFSFIFLGVMFFFSLPFTLVSLGILGMDFGVSIFLIRKQKRLKKESEVQAESQAAFLSHSLIALPRLRASGVENRVFKLWKKRLQEQLSLEERTERIQNTLSLIHRYLPWILLWILLAMAIFEWHQPPLGNFFAFYLALLSLCSSLKDLLVVSFEVESIFPQLKSGEDLLKASQEESGIAPGPLEGKISLENVTFSYQSQTSFLFDNLSLTIQPQEKVGILGTSGSGRTSFLRLLLGFESPLAGKILYDQKDLSSLNIRLLRQKIGIVFRSEGIFAGTLLENINLGRQFSKAEIERALSLADFQKDVDQFPMGLHTLLPEGGATLAGGQKQRLLLARALISNPSILLLDQAFDSLDNRSLEIILANLKSLKSTQILLSQDREMLERFADRLYFLDQGKISVVT